MEFKDRTGTNLNRKKLKIISQTPTEMIVDMERYDQVTEDGTQINAEVFNEFQKEINAANSNAATALETAQTASGNAQTAINTANTAKSTATTASTNAENALKAAESAANAQEAAEDARDAAQEAQRQAEAAAQNATKKVEEITTENTNKANTAVSNASSALTKANTAISDSATALRTAQTAATTANTASSTATTAKNLATEAKNAATNAETISQNAYNKAIAVENALADRGTTVKVSNQAKATVEFTTDPQTQINSKLSKNFAGFGAKTTLANTDAFVIQDAQTKENKVVTMASVVSAVMNATYPIGAIYLSVNSTNPATIFGGKWEAWGAGRVPVGIGNNGETNYTTAELTGGSENSIAQHTHTQIAHTHIANSHSHTFTGTEGYFWNIAGSEYGGNGGFEQDIGSGTYGKGGNYSTPLAIFKYTPLGENSKTTVTLQNSTPTINSTGTKGGNRPPFITCYMWKRVG